LHRYLAEFDFRYNNRSGLGIEDTERAERALRGIEGKRLTYQQPREAAHASAECARLLQMEESKINLKS